MTEQTLAKPRVVNPSRISAIWIIPIIAAMLAGFLIYKGISEAGIMIRVHFPDGNGIIVGKTPVKYKGIDVGIVKSIEVDEELSGVYVNIEMVKKAEQSLNTGAKFWLVRPQASLTQISGLDTIVSGNYIAIAVGQGYYATEFDALHSPPLDVPDDALLVTLKSESLGSLNIGSPVYFKRIPVGEIIRTTLSPEASDIIVEAVVEPEFKYLVKKASRFWHVSGVSINADMGGINIQTESLAALIAGGIAFDSPENSDEATNDDGFTLYQNYETAGRGARIRLTLADAQGISLHGSDIRYLGLKIGNLFSVNLSSDKKRVNLDAVIDPQLIDMIGDDTQFWLLKPNISFQGVENLETVLSGYRIQIQPATTPSTKRDFMISPQAPLPEGALQVTLLAKQLDSIQKGDPILYRGLRIGEVQMIGVTNDSAYVKLTLLIQPEYTKLITAQSRFFMTPAMRMQASLEQGVEVTSSPIEALVRGGISLINLTTPTNKSSIPTSFNLFKDERAAIAGIQPAPLSLALLTNELNGLQKGAPVYFREYQVGKVSDINLNAQQQFVITVTIKDEHKALLNSSSRFWNVSGVSIEANLSGINIESGSLLSVAMGGLAFDTQDMQAATTPLPTTLFADKAQAMAPAQTITLQVPVEAHLTKGSELRYSGFTIGEVSQIELHDDLKHIQATVSIKSDYALQFTQAGTRYWVEQADVTITGINNPEALLLGDFISAWPGNGKPTDHFVATIGKPISLNNDGLLIFLQSDQLHSHKVGTPLLHRQVKVGEVEKAELEETGHSVLLQVRIQPRYAHLVRNNTHFWNASGVALTGSLLKGVAVNTESVEAILAGGIAFSTPDDQPIQPKARPGTRMRLYGKAQPEWRHWRPAITRE